MRATDPRTREILERTTALAEGQIGRLHGACRDGRTGDPRRESEQVDAPPAPREVASRRPEEVEPMGERP